MATLDIRIDRERVTKGDEFAVAIAIPPQPSDRTASSEFVLALDASQSMTWPARNSQEGLTRWDLARRGALALVASLNPTVDMHILLFSGNSRVVAAARADTLHAELEGLLPITLEEDFSGTDIGKALQTSYGLLDTSNATSRRVVLLSDGDPTVGNCSPAHLAGVAKGAGTRDIYTDPIGLGAEANVDLLLQLSGTGACDHVASRAEADHVMSEIMSRLAEGGQQVAASGGELRLEVSPFFSVVGVYQLMPAKRTFSNAITSGTEGATKIDIALGAIGSGEARPVFALKLRAPSRTSAAPLPLLRPTATIRRRRGSVQLTGPEVTIWSVSDRDTSPDPQILQQIRAVEFEAKTATRLRSANAELHEQVYVEAEQEARSIGLSELADQYLDALVALRSGLDANDVRNEQRATSSRSTTTPRSILRERPVLAPSSRQRPAQRNLIFSHADWTDDPTDKTPSPKDRVADREPTDTDYGDPW